MLEMENESLKSSLEDRRNKISKLQVGCG